MLSRFLVKLSFFLFSNKFAFPHEVLEWYLPEVSVFRNFNVSTGGAFIRGACLID